MQPDVLKAIRKAIGWTQEQMAVQLGLSRVTVGLMERGSEPITARTARAVERIAYFGQMRTELAQQLADLESGKVKLTTRADGGDVDSTSQAIEQCRRRIEEIDSLLSR